MKIFYFLLFGIFFLINVYAQKYIVGVNITNRVKEINIKERFLIKEGSEKWPEGHHVIPFEISDNDIKNSIIRMAFILKVLRMDENSYNDYWLDEKSKGRIRRPVKVDNFKMMKRFLEREKGSIGYLPENMVSDKIKVIGSFSL